LADRILSMRGNGWRLAYKSLTLSWDGLDGQSRIYLGFINRMGNPDFLMTKSATLPKTSLLKPLRP
jgi:hypothetical protein